MITFKEYAKQHNTTYETIRRTVTKHPDVFQEHIKEIQRVRYLDEEGERILDEMRGVQPRVVFNREKHEQQEDIKQQTIILQNKILELEERLNEAKDQIIARDEAYKDLQVKYIALLEGTTEDTEQPKEDTEESHGDLSGTQPTDVAEDVPEQPQNAQKLTFAQRVKVFFTGNV